MYNHPIALSALMPSGDPTPEALHREAYYNHTEIDPVTNVRRTRDHRDPARARFLRAQVAAKVGQFFSIA